MIVDLVELDDLGADAISTKVVECLLRIGFSREFLDRNWINLTCDGASVMLGKKTGVAKRLKQLFPLLFIWHCMAHRLELSVGNAVKGTKAVYCVFV